MTPASTTVRPCRRRLVRRPAARPQARRRRRGTGRRRRGVTGLAVDRIARAARRRAACCTRTVLAARQPRDPASFQGDRVRVIQYDVADAATRADLRTDLDERRTELQALLDAYRSRRRRRRRLRRRSTTSSSTLLRAWPRTQLVAAPSPTPGDLAGLRRDLQDGSDAADRRAVGRAAPGRRTSAQSELAADDAQAADRGATPQSARLAVLVAAIVVAVRPRRSPRPCRPAWSALPRRAPSARCSASLEAHGRRRPDRRARGGGPGRDRPHGGGAGAAQQTPARRSWPPWSRPRTRSRRRRRSCRRRRRRSRPRREETSAQSGVVAGAAEEVSRNVQTVAAGAEEMGASIREISQNANEAARVAAAAVAEAETTTATVTRLGESSREIGDVVKVITSHRRADQPAGAQRHDRGGPGRRGRQGLRRRGQRGQGAGAGDGAGDRGHRPPGRGHPAGHDRRGRRRSAGSARSSGRSTTTS